jgi:hypothetical protein
MRLDRPFLKLPITFDADTIAAEVRALPATAWAPHPTGFKGNEAVRLITPGGIETDDMDGQMAATEHLLACPSIMAVMAEIGAVWGRSRLMGLGPGGEVPLHVDSHYYWRTHWRIHIPIITNPGVTFACGPETVHMAAGECWLFDSFRWHRVRNASAQQRIHLVLDTVGGGRLRDLMEAAQRGAAAVQAPTGEAGGPLAFERINSPKVMSPWELRAHLDFLKGEAVPHPKLPAATKRLDDFAEDWAATWARYGADDDGFDDYVALLEGVKADLEVLGGGDILLKNRLELYFTLDHLVFLNAIKIGRLTEQAAA